VRQQGPAAIAAAGGKILAHQKGDQLVVLAPKVTAPAGGKFPAPAYVAKTLPPEAKANHGWDVVKDPQQRLEMQAKVRSQAPANAPAKAVRPAELDLAKIKTQAPSKPVVTGEAIKPAVEPGIEKTPKEKNAETMALENKPAVEPGATPKLKTKKHALENAGEENAIAGATPAHKLKKKKVPTPSDEYGTPKHSNLEPFSNGEEPKPKVHPPVNPNGPGAAEEAAAKAKRRKAAVAATPF
jgi:hypothetical protein